MTRDEQEAKSRAHYAFGVLRLESGRLAIFNAAREFIGTTNSIDDLDLSFSRRNVRRQMGDIKKRRRDPLDTGDDI